MTGRWCFWRLRGALLDEAARPFELSRSGYGVLGMVAKATESVFDDLYRCRDKHVSSKSRYDCMIVDFGNEEDVCLEHAQQRSKEEWTLVRVARPTHSAGWPAAAPVKPQ